MGSRTKNGFNLDGDDLAGEFSGSPDDRKRRPTSGGKRGGAGSGGAAPPSCQVDDCPAILTEAKRYHRRHKVCEFHAKAAVVVLAGARQRFCQQCSRFHELPEFDEARRSCRRRLAGHNERRRKGSSSEPLGDASSSSGATDEKNRGGNSASAIAAGAAGAYKHF